MDNLVDWIMSHNTLLYSIFFGIMLIVAVVFIVRYYVINKNITQLRHIVPVFITLALFAYSFEQVSWGHFYKILSFNMFTFYCLLAYLYGDKINKRKVIDIAFWFLAISSVIAYAFSFSPAFNEYFMYAGDRFTGIFGNPNTFQFCLAITIAITLTMFFRKNISRSKMYFRVGVLSLLGLSTKSKAFMILIILLLIIYLVYEFIKYPKIAAIELAILLCVIGVVYLLWGKNIVEYVINRIGLNDARSFMNGLTTDRWELWGRYLGFWSEDTWALFFGKGMSSPDFIYGGTHNDFIFVLYNLGIIGALLVVSLGVTYFICSKDKRHHFSIWNMVPLITIIAVCCVENLLIRVFSLLIVFATMFIFDQENYGKKIVKLKESKVMLICTTDNMIWQFLIPHIRDLQSAGAEVHCVCTETGFWFNELQNKYGFVMHNVKMERNPINFTNVKAYFKLCSLQRKEKYDLIYCQQPVGGMLGRLVGARFYLPVIYTAHGLFFYKGNSKLKNFVYRTAEHIMASWTDVFITMNEEDYTATLKWQPKYKYKIHGIGMDPAKYDGKKVNKSALRQELGIKPTDKVVISIGEFRGVKNYSTMVSVMDDVIRELPNTKYLICGTGKGRQEVEDKVNRLGIHKNVVMLGYRKDVDKIIQISDVMLHSSYREGLTMSIMEVMHFGLPVVTTTARGNKDLIEDGKGGYTLDPYDEIGQADRVVELLNNKELCKSMGEYNKKQVKYYYIDSVRKELKKIYQDFGIL